MRWFSMEKTTTLIQLQKSTASRIKDFKNTQLETYDEIVNRALDKFPEVDK